MIGKPEEVLVTLSRHPNPSEIAEIATETVSDYYVGTNPDYDEQILAKLHQLGLSGLRKLKLAPIGGLIGKYLPNNPNFNFTLDSLEITLDCKRISDELLNMLDTVRGTLHVEFYTGELPQNLLNRLVQTGANRLILAGYTSTYAYRWLLSANCRCPSIDLEEPKDSLYLGPFPDTLTSTNVCSIQKQIAERERKNATQALASFGDRDATRLIISFL